MVKVSYYPGCTLKNKAKELDKYAVRCAEILGVEMEEIENWQCCGGVFCDSSDEVATKLSAVRALACAARRKTPLVTVCTACHNVIKRTLHALRYDAVFSERVRNYLGDEAKGAEDAEVYHYLELLRDVVGFETLKGKVVNELKGKRVAAYYGCLFLRPGSVMQTDDAEDPRIMESFIKSLGAEPVIYPMRNECCGAYTFFEEKEAALKKGAAVLKSAENFGADLIAAACPLCRYNLESSSKSLPGGAEKNLPVVYFTELLAEALGVKEARYGM